MTLSALDQRDLLLPLAEGLRENPMWETFLRRLQSRTEATQACLLVRMTPTAHLPPITRVASARPGLADPDFDMLSALGLIPYAALRPGRVYALEEMLDFDRPDAPDRQREALKQAGIAHARFIRVVTRAENNAWIILLSERRPFDAGDSALLSALAPHLAISLDTLGQLGSHQLRASIAEQALDMLGIGQMAFDRAGRVVLTDKLASDVLGARSGERLPLSAAAQDRLAKACTEIARGTAQVRKVVRIDHRGVRDILLRPLPAPMGTAVAVIGSIRLTQQTDRRASPQIVAALHGLSEREAALAEAMSRGQTILEAGSALQLTPETSRNYTKRAYGKTGASGQADLVRQILTGLSPLA